MNILQRQIQEGISSDDDAAEAEALSVIQPNLLRPLGSKLKGFLSFNAVVRVGEIRAEHLVQRAHRGDSPTVVLRLAQEWIDEGEQYQRRLGVPGGSCYASYVHSISCAREEIQVLWNHSARFFCAFCMGMVNNQSQRLCALFSEAQAGYCACSLKSPISSPSCSTTRPSSTGTPAAVRVWTTWSSPGRVQHAQRRVRVSSSTWKKRGWR